MAFLDKTGLEHLWAHMITKLGDKVDKVSGKCLSTNDFTNADKAKVDAIPSNPKYTDTTYTAGDGISISNTNVISADITPAGNNTFTANNTFNKRITVNGEGRFNGTASFNDITSSGVVNFENATSVSVPDPKYNQDAINMGYAATHYLSRSTIIGERWEFTLQDGTKVYKQVMLLNTD